LARLTKLWNDWWYEALPLERVHVFRMLIYLYVPLDVITSRWVQNHGLVPESWYQPLWFARALGIPAPTATVMAAVAGGLLTLPLLGAAGYLRRFIAPAVALLYFYWSFVAFTYGKVDDDRVALITALTVLAAVPWRGGGPNARAGWTLRMVQMSFVLTYFLAGVTKLLVGGPGWVTSTTIERAITRRGTVFGDLLLNVPWSLIVLQSLILAFELTAPAMLMRNRVGRVYVAAAIVFHVASAIGITIYFRSHLVCVIAFLPLEKLYDRFRARRSVVVLAGEPSPGVVHTE
jgi:hypothetical protein